MPPPTYICEGANMQPGDDVCGSVGDSVCDNPSISRMVVARDLKFCVLTEGLEP